MADRELPFDPCPFLNHPHQQTVFSSLVHWIPEPLSEAKIIPLDDGDKLVMEVSTPKNWKETDPTVLCVHGLCGSHQSSYLLRLVNRLEPIGIKVVRFNMRGCGSGKGLSRRIYHSGRSEDLFEAVKVLKAEFPKSPITLIGFSLGGNVVLKMMGELASLGGVFINRAIAVSPPVDLACSVALLGVAAGGMYERYFYKRLRKDVLDLHKRFKELPRIHLPANLKIPEFDRIYTVPMTGFASVPEYYARCSSLPIVSDIDVPCKILLSQDDPIVAHHSLDNLSLPSHIEIYKTKNGGHMGYLGNPSGPRGFYWLDSILSDWILET